jgi:hypothetical protein
VAALLAGVLALPGCEKLDNIPGPDPRCDPRGEREFLNVVSGDSQAGAPGETLAIPLTVRGLDWCNRATVNRTVIWTPHQGSVPSSETRTDADGYASTRWTLVDDGSGVNRLQAELLDGHGQTQGRTVRFVATLQRAPCDTATLSDPFDFDGRWTTTSEAAPGFREFTDFRASGGLPDGYRHMTHVLTGRGLIAVSHMYALTYEPRTQGAIRRIRYSEDRKQFDPPFAGAAVGTGFVVEQAGRRVLRDLPELREPTWHHFQVDMVASDLPAIDLSASGGPIRFGYYRANSDSTATVQHGIDNWRVELCR